MIFSRDYSRALLGLRQENSHFCADRKGIYGRAVVEVKNGRAGAMLYAQGIQNGCICSLYLICCKNEKYVPLKAVLVNIKNGRAEVKWEFNPDNISGSGFRLEDVKALAVITDKGETVLTAYFDKPVDWQKKIHKQSEQAEKAAETNKGEPTQKQKQLQKVKTGEKAETKAMAEDTEKEETEVKAECPEKNDYQNAEKPKLAGRDFTEVVNRFKRDLDELRKYAYMESMDKNEKQVKPSTIPSATMEYITQNRPVEMPFGSDGGEYKKISLKELCLIDEYMHKYENNPTIRNCCIKYGHLLFGKKDGKSILCVPDEERTIKDGRKLGFCDYKNGYRIMNIQ